MPHGERVRNHYATAAPRLPFVDCARGYAILMVITCHLSYSYPGLPFPVSRITVNGWFGVQLFFLASCFTLLRSWHAEMSRAGAVDFRGFLFRRLFRIAPAYYSAAAFYFVISPPVGGLDLRQGTIWLAFLNCWSPGWLAVDGGWQVVPGGWSIAVEFSFYLMFPLFAALATSLWRAVALTLVLIVLGAVANIAAAVMLANDFSIAAVGNFLYFWPPNQLSVFALGGVVFFILGGPKAAARVPRPRAPNLLPPKLAASEPQPPAWLDQYGPAIAWVSAGVFVATLYLPRGHYLGDWPVLPEHLTAAIPLAGLFVGLASARGPLVNRFVAKMGRVSFSAYLLHFAVLKLVPFIPGRFGAAATSYEAIAAFAMGWIATVGITYALASLSFACIEAPMIEMGKRLIRQLRPLRHDAGRPRSLNMAR